MGRERVQTRADEDTLEAIAEYQQSDETPDLSQAEAVRRLLRSGLAVKGYPVAGHNDMETTTVQRAGQTGTVIAVLAIGFLGLLIAVLGANGVI